MVTIYRVIVRGHFADIDDATRQALLADQERHDFLNSSFTSDGTFTYDQRLVAFNLRYEVRDPDGEAVETIERQALDRAAHWLDGRGYGHKRLRASATDMASMWTDRRPPARSRPGTPAGS